MKTGTKVAIGIGVTAAAALGLYVAFSGGSKPAKLPPSDGEGGTGTTDELPLPLPDDKEFSPDDWVVPAAFQKLPTAADVQGDLVTNWGKTPSELRPLFLLAEQVSGIRGVGRILALIAKRESNFAVAAHNDSTEPDGGEVGASTRAYINNKDDRPPLKHGLAAAAFGSGGLFGLLAPYFLWQGVNSVKAKAPLLAGEPQIMFFPRVAVFGGLAYLQRVLAYYDVKSFHEIKIAWANPSLISAKNRGGKKYNEVRARFQEDIEKLGIDISQLPSIAQIREDAKKKWPGVIKVFEQIAGGVPMRKANV